MSISTVEIFGIVVSCVAIVALLVVMILMIYVYWWRPRYHQAHMSHRDMFQVFSRHKAEYPTHDDKMELNEHLISGGRTMLPQQSLLPPGPSGGVSSSSFSLPPDLFPYV